MGARAEALAKQFEAKALETTTLLERLTDADWKKTTTAERWTVGVVAHHVAGAHELIAGLVKGVASGQASQGVPMDAIHAMNARHAQEHAGCTRAETLALHRQGVAAAAAMLRGLDDAQLDRSGTVIVGMPAMSAAQVATAVLIGHMDEHMGSIRATIAG